MAFLTDLAPRLRNRVQITTDGHRPYIEAIEEAFGQDVDYAILIKYYGTDPNADRKFSPPVVLDEEVRVIHGDPNPDKISTSYVERQNLTMRMGIRRFTRLTNAFSKRVENHAAAVALHFMYMNIARPHKSLANPYPRTPAMAAGVAHHPWPCAEFAGLLHNRQKPQPRPFAGPRAPDTSYRVGLVAERYQPDSTPSRGRGMTNGKADRVNVYVDGFNLYYGCLRGTPFKWLDLAALCSQLLPDANIKTIRYFTARVHDDPASKGERARQDTYLRALRTIPNLTIKEGYFLTKPHWEREVEPIYAPNPKVPNPKNPMVRVWKTEEKGSDVNLATSLLLDAAAREFSQAWVISNDSDLAWPIQMVRRIYRLPVSVFKPDRPRGYPKGDRPDSHHVIKAARKFRRIRREHLEGSQFPLTLTDADGAFGKPSRWA